MTTRAQLTAAVAATQELDQVTAALAALQAPGATASTVAEITISGNAAYRITLNPSVAALITLLTNRQTALTNALAAVGITS